MDARLKWLETRLDAAQLLSQNIAINTATKEKQSAKGLRLGIDLGTSNIVSMLIDDHAMPIAVCITPADVVRDGVVWDYFGAVDIVRAQLATLKTQVAELPDAAYTSYPPGTEARISVNVIEATGLKIAGVIDEPSAVAQLLTLDQAAVIDIGGGTTGIAVVENGQVIYSGDEATGGHHVTLTLAGGKRLSLEAAETYKKTGNPDEIWGGVRPVYEKMIDIVHHHLREHSVKTLYLSGGSCMIEGVYQLFKQNFPKHTIVLPKHALFLTPLAITAHGLSWKIDQPQKENL